MSPALDERKGEPNYEKLPAIQLCSRSALDLFLSAYWPELLRDLNDHARLVRELEIESIKLDAETRHAEAMRLQLRTAVSRISELERRVEAAEAALRQVVAIARRRHAMTGGTEGEQRHDDYERIALAALPAEAEGKKCAACGSDIPGGCPSCTGTDEGGGRL